MFKAQNPNFKCQIKSKIQMIKALNPYFLNEVKKFEARNTKQYQNSNDQIPKQLIASLAP